MRDKLADLCVGLRKISSLYGVGAELIKLAVNKGTVMELRVP